MTGGCVSVEHLLRPEVKLQTDCDFFFFTSVLQPHISVNVCNL